MKKQPLTAVTLLFILGIVIADKANCDWRWPLGLSCCTLLIAVASQRARNYALALLLVTAGAANLSFRTATLSPCDIRTIANGTPALATVRGRLTETPFQRVYERGQRESWRTIAFISLDSISRSGQTNLPVSGALAVSTSGILSTSYYEGQNVEITGVMQLPAGAMTEGMFDYRKYLERLGIYYQLQVSSTNDWRRVGPQQSPTFSDRFLTWGQSALALGLPNMDEPVRLLWAMTLGWKTALSGEVSEPFMRSGTMHIFAISGLHIALIAMMIVGMLRCFMIPRSACALLVIPLIWIYTGFTGWQASAIRSTIMTSVIVAGWSINRPSNLLNSLAAAAFIILIWDPQQLFQAGFQLSFLVVASLALLSPVLTRWKERLLQGDPFLPDELRSKRERYARKAADFLLSGIATSLAAWLGSIPIVAYYFHFLTPSSLVANLIVVPLSSFALASNMASLAVASWFPSCAELFNHAAWCFMLWMVRISEWSADFPAGCFNIEAPRPITFLLYYFLLIAVMAGWLKSAKWRAPCIAALVTLSGFWFFQRQQERSEARIAILPLHGGEAIYVEHPTSENRMLINGGNADAVKFTTKQYLRTRGVNQLPALLLTHGDVQEMGGAELLQQLFSTRKVYVSHLRFRSSVYRRVIDSFESEPHLLTRIKRDDRVGPWTILHPEKDEHFRQAADGAIVAHGNLNGVRVLLLSDLSRAGQAILLERYPNLRTDIIISGLPRQSEPVTEPLLEAINPRVVIITDALYPANAHASRRLRERLRGRKFDVWFTSESGALSIRLKDGAWDMHPAIPRSSVPAINPIEDETDSQTQSASAE